jgi:hypothetical protein
MEEAKEFIEKKNKMIVIEFDPNHLSRFGTDGVVMQIIDPQNPNMPDFENGAILRIVSGRYEEYGEEVDEKNAEKKVVETGIYIMGHQHSQHQLYETIERIQQRSDLTFYGYDGGSSFTELYEEWKKRGGVASVPDYQRVTRNIAKIFFTEKEYESEYKRLFDIIEVVTEKSEAEMLQKKYIRDNMKKIMEKRPKTMQILSGMIDVMKKDKEYYGSLTEDELKETCLFALKGPASDAIICCIHHKEIKDLFLNNGRDGSDRNE